MPSLGDLANDVAKLVYEYRIPVGILSIAVAIAVVAFALRRGWIGTARRHPARTGVVLAIALAVALPTGWYLASPIFIRTSLVEAPPAVASTSVAPTAVASTALAPNAVAPTAAPSNEPGTASPSAPADGSQTEAPTATAAPLPTATPKPTPKPFQVSTVASGEFSGTDEFHFGNGTASIIEIAPDRYHLRLEDFSVRNGPDLYVYLSPSADGWTKNALEVGVLKATDGSFGYDLPKGVDPADFRSAIIWCKQFSHLFATAPF
ncbi:MAG: DM13 domain-containing protein [Candidatus Limnocylindrales bacterium]